MDDRAINWPEPVHTIGPTLTNEELATAIQYYKAQVVWIFDKVKLPLADELLSRFRGQLEALMEEQLRRATPAYIVPAAELPHVPAQTVWSCKIGTLAGLVLPDGADLPMREAVERAYKRMTGQDSKFNFSGWGGKLDKIELEVALGKEPGE